MVQIKSHFCNKINIILSAKPKTEFIHPQIGLIQICLEKPYYLKNDQLYCKYKVSLKESLTGFIKIFKDPFGKSHEIR